MARPGSWPGIAVGTATSGQGGGTRTGSRVGGHDQLNLAHYPNLWNTPHASPGSPAPSCEWNGDGVARGGLGKPREGRLALVVPDQEFGLVNRDGLALLRSRP